MTSEDELARQLMIERIISSTAASTSINSYFRSRINQFHTNTLQRLWRPNPFRSLGEYVPNDFTFDIRQAEVAALVAEGEPLVVDAELVEHGGVQVVDGDAVLLCVVAEFVGGAVGGSGPDAAAGHPY